MNRLFESDPFPGKPKILFIGLADNSHTHSWIDLLKDTQFNLRLFSPTHGTPPDEWPVRTYVTTYEAPPVNPETRALLYGTKRLARFATRQTGRLRGKGTPRDLALEWLAKVITQWQPDIVHTLGIRQGGEFYLDTCRKYGLENSSTWILTTRGGSDLTIPHLDPIRRPRLTDVLSKCDQLICDNEEDLRIARELGLRDEQRASIAPVPGAGGVDVDSLRRRWQGKTSTRRPIVWPKAYDSAWGKMLPSLEALKLCWDKIQPCEVHLLSMADESFMWYWTLPEEIRKSCYTYRRISHGEVLELMTSARVMLAPALTDGVPNSLYEGMATGAFPIVSPLDTIRPVVKEKENVLFARNLYPHEIALALTRAMTDDALVDVAAANNLELVGRIANRAVIGPRVADFYEKLASRKT